MIIPVKWTVRDVAKRQPIRQVTSKTMLYEHRLREIIWANDWFMTVLEAVRDCNPPDWFVGGGVIRNVVWDCLHGYSSPTPVNDVDVAFFDPQDLSLERDRAVEGQLLARLPTVPWEATNQASVHLWFEKVFGYPVVPLQSSEDAISTWPETVTSIGVRLLSDGHLLIVAPFGLDDLFNMVLRRNPRRVTVELFRRRVREKEIQKKWPMVTVVDG